MTELESSLAVGLLTSPNLFFFFWNFQFCGTVWQNLFSLFGGLWSIDKFGRRERIAGLVLVVPSSWSHHRESEPSDSSLNITQAMTWISNSRLLIHGWWKRWKNGRAMPLSSLTQIPARHSKYGRLYCDGALDGSSIFSPHAKGLLPMFPVFVYQ